MGEFWIQDDQTMVLIGDSITDCGRSGAEEPLGDGYVRTFSELVTARHPERKVRYLNKGISGNRITDLKARWKDDVLRHRPDRLSIMIGINDLHTHVNGAPGGVSPELFAQIYDELLDITRRELDCEVALLTPFYISRDHGAKSFEGQVLELILEYIDTVKAMSRAYSTILVDIHEAFQRHLTFRDPAEFCPEPVHPYHAGHTIIASELLCALEGRCRVSD